MSNAQHTPGPWHTHKGGIAFRVYTGPVAADPDGAANVASIHDFSDTGRANARLIAAAPDMHDALDMILRVTANATPEVALARVREIAWAAIAKATGAQS